MPLHVVRLEDRLTPATPSDPGVASQWGLAAVSAPQGWDAATGTGRTIIAVLDTGVDLYHPDLEPNLWRNPGEIPDNGRDDDANGYVDDINGYDFSNNDPVPWDDRGHGTHVAGIAGAVGNNGVGGSGVAWAAKIMPIKFIDAAGRGSTANAARAVDYAVRNGAKVINASFATPGDDPVLAAAIGRARAAGVIVVTAAGNSGQNADAASTYPANYARTFDNTIAVAATTQSGGLASWSNFGPNTVALAAPGEGISSTASGGGQQNRSGTSMAAPFVSGALAVLWDQHPDWGYAQVLAKLRASTDQLPALAGKVGTGGQLNLAKLLDAPVSVAPAPVSPPTAPLVPSRTVAGVLNTTTVSDGRTSRATFTVNENFTAGEVRIFVDLSHTRSSDLHIRLVSPDGRVGVLFNRKAGENLSGVTFVATGYAGDQARGQWVLEVFDVVGGEGGTFRGASLNFG